MYPPLLGLFYSRLSSLATILVFADRLRQVKGEFLRAIILPAELIYEWIMNGRAISL